MNIRRICFRLLRLKVLITFIFLANCVTWIYWFLTKENLSPLHMGSSATLLYTQFEVFDNKIAEVLQYFQRQHFQYNVVVISEKNPYPPLNIPLGSNIHHIITSDISLEKAQNKNIPQTYLSSKYVFVMPDGVVFSQDILDTIDKVYDLLNNQNINLVAVVSKAFPIKCFDMKFHIKQWTLTYSNITDMTNCKFVDGVHIAVLKTEDFLKLPKPFLRPIFMSIYIQATLKNWKIKVVYTENLSKFSSLYQAESHKWKLKENTQTRIKSMYQELGIKLVKANSGNTEWYGCSKLTKRCFGTVIKDMPEYLYVNRWTPPCCLDNIRTTAIYVFNILEKLKVRYWLEGGSLLGAVRNGDIIPWDYDVDIGIYKEDLVKIDYFQRSDLDIVYEDENGFMWEKAIEGDFYRVQFSQSNHLHVDIFPFYSKNGIMTKDTWIQSHRQDTEFPENYLKPLGKIKFLGVMVNVPNNCKDFLEYKFGKGVVENPRYPNMQNVI